MPLKTVTGILLALLIVAPLWLQVRAETVADENQMKAGFLFNVARYVTWPPEALGDEKDPFIIGILGTDPFKEILTPLTAKTVKNRKVAFRRLNGPADARNCHILFIGHSERAHLLDILPHLKKASVLTVSDIEGFTDAGGMIRVFPDDGKIRFMVNLQAADEAGLRISSQMLKLTTHVRDE